MGEQWGSLEDWKQLAEQRKTVNVQRSMEIDRLRARLERAEGLLRGCILNVPYKSNLYGRIDAFLRGD